MRLVLARVVLNSPRRLSLRRVLFSFLHSCPSFSLPKKLSFWVPRELEVAVLGKRQAQHARTSTLNGVHSSTETRRYGESGPEYREFVRAFGPKEANLEIVLPSDDIA